MKKIIIIAIALALFTGFAIADPGINQTPETQGITTATTIDVLGNFASTTDLQWRQTTDDAGLNGIPPLGEAAGLDGRPPYGEAPTHYASAYTEDTYSNGIGLIAYDKNMDIETSEQLAGQWNIDADKQLEYVGVDGARVYSDEYIMVDGIGNISYSEDQMLCVFVGNEVTDYWDFWTWTHPSYFPAYCNFAESGSTIDMTVANVRTNSMDRFIIPSADTSVELEHDLLVTELIDGVPSSGSASAFMNVLIMEARGGHFVWQSSPQAGVSLISANSPLMEKIEFSEATSIIGEITTFDKEMNYNSIYTGEGELTTFVVLPANGGT